MQEIKYQDIDKIGVELLKKNNYSYYKSDLSDVMSTIFIAANKKEGIREINGENYMKSGIIPKRVYYIYSDQLNKLNKRKIYDIVNFNGEDCIWFYSINAIDMIGENPVGTITEIYNALLKVFKQYDHTKLVFDDDYKSDDFNKIEKHLLKYVMIIRLMVFLNKVYNVLDLEENKHILAYVMKTCTCFTEDSCLKFIDDVIDNCDEIDYFFNRRYLKSYMLLESRNCNYDKYITVTDTIVES